MNLGIRSPAVGDALLERFRGPLMKRHFSLWDERTLHEGSGR